MMLEKIRFYISPYFLIRYYLQRDIKYFAKKYKFEGSVLDFGCGQKPYKKFFKDSEYVGIDFEEYSKNKDFPEDKPNFYFREKYLENLTLPFKSESFNNTVSFQVLEHHRNPEFMIREVARVTKKGGLILLSSPFIYALHEEPRDYQRLTHYALKKLFKRNDCEIVEVKKQGSIFSVISMLINEQLSAFAAGSQFHYLLATVIYLPFLLFQYVSLFLEGLVRSNKIFINYIILAKKR